MTMRRKAKLPPFALRIRNMACNALYRHFAIIEIVLQLFRLSFLLPVPAPLPVHTFCSLLFALFVVFLAQLAHHLRKSVRHLSATATFGSDLFAAFSCCFRSRSYSCCCCSYFSSCCCLCSFLFFLVQNKLCHVKSKVTQHSLCWSVCACVCVLGATFNSARCVGAARREKILQKILHPQPTRRTTNCC